MLLHNSTILELEDPQLATIYDDPSWSQVVNIINHLPSKFWNTSKWVQHSLLSF
jgi:hypothetical protein